MKLNIYNNTISTNFTGWWLCEHLSDKYTYIIEKYDLDLILISKR